MFKRKAPRFTFWRGSVLWGRIKIKGHVQKWSLRTGDPAIAKARVEADRQQLLAASYYGDDRRTYEATVTSWAEHHIPHEVAPKTSQRYAVSLKQLEPYLLGLYLDEIDRAKIGEIVQARRDAGVTTATIRRDLYGAVQRA